MFCFVFQNLRNSIYYYPTETSKSIGLYAVRYKQYKAHFYTKGSLYSGSKNPDRDCRPQASEKFHNPPLVYDLHQDPSELYPLDENEYAHIFAELTRMKDEYNADMTWAESELLKPTDAALEPCCNPGCTPHPICCACTGRGGGGHSDHV